MSFPFFKKIVASFAILCLSALQAFASGAQPDAPILVMSEADGQAQLGVKNTENFPLLLNTTIIELAGDDESVSVLVWPPVTRLDANQRQVIRFVLDKSAEPLQVQLLKRVSIEGLAPKSNNPDEINTVRVNIRTTLPLVISPKGLEQIREPWTKLEFRRTASRITVSNPSRYVVRLQQEVQLAPSNKTVMLLQRPYVLPGESFDVTLPGDILSHTVTGLRFFPASPWGFSVDPYDVELPASNPAS